MTTTTATAVYVGSCSFCGTFVRTTTPRNIERYGKTLRGDGTCPKCPYTSPTVFLVQGRVTDTPCNEKCTDAKGVKCDCQCGGHNHGSTAA
jgi:hypothetical protein